MKQLEWADLNGACRPSGDEVNFKDCPVCGNSNYHLYVNETTGKWYCHAGEHGSGGVIVGHTPDPDALLEQLELELDPPKQRPWDWPEIGAYDGGLKPCPDAALSMDGRRTPGLIPFYNDMGLFIYWVAYNPDLAPRYENMPGDHPLYVPDWSMDRRSVIVEGPFDAMRVAAAGYRAIALLGKKLPARLQADLMYALGSHPRPVVMLDGDAVEEAQVLARWLEQQPGIDAVDVCLLPDGCDPGDLTNEEVVSWIE